jgi:hypothetical protein
MSELRDGPGFALEALAAFRISRKFGREDLDRDEAVKTGVAGPVDLTHAPGANQAEDFIGAESSA